MSDAGPDRVDAAVSYSRLDEARVEPLLAGLRARGLLVWFDKDIPGGALWEEIIARKYRASGALLFFVSKASLASQRCSEEVSTART
ncbi:toll/interleukin-1 receptor domain-containing protein, partial [Escherichia coli]|uniref:toll/interleukin-1 receptor domain-containing protein n=1 Tax=Escherichia coli TaxID=562 RepID=UPI00130AD8BB